MENDKQNETDGKHHHAQGAQEQNQRNAAIGGLKEEHNG
jgi:hypothetical protein